MAFVLRAASLDDIDEITDVVCTAMPMDPQWDYRMPRRKEFPQDTWNCTRRDYANVLSDEEKEKHRMNVIIAPSNEDKEVKKIIAVAVWDLTVQHYSMDDVPCYDRRDADLTRMKAFLDALMKSKKELFDDVYGDHQLHLGMICTLPDYQRRGAGTMQCKWGLDLAKEKKLEVTLFASPMGRLLYEHLGFDVRGTVIVQVKGEEEKLTIKAMAYDTPGRSLVVKLLAHVWNLFSMRFYTIQRDDI